MASNLTICYEGIQRVYRNAVVGYLRQRMKHAFPHNYEEKIRAPFEKEWDQLRLNAQERRQTGEISSEISDDFDLLSVNHFFNLFDAYYEKLTSSAATPSDQQHKLSKQTVLQWIKTIKNMRDPLSHPSEQDFSYEDSFVLLDCARRVLLKLGLSDEAKQLKTLLDDLNGRPLSMEGNQEPLEARLPPRESVVTDFIGRKTELERLGEWFRDPVSRRWALAGEGGKGKSAIAYQFAEDVMFSAPEPYHIVLWLSAKKQKFEEGITQKIAEPDFHNVDTALSCILRYYGWIDEVGSTIERKRERVLELLDSFPALIVVDDVDSLEGEEEAAIEFFVLDIPRTKSKILFTSRRVVLGMGNITTHIGGLTPADAKEFIFSRCRAMELDCRLLTDIVVSEMIRITEASPLYLGDLVRLFAVVPPKEAISLWREKAGAEARQYALGRELEQLQISAKEVLMAACISDGPVSFPELESVTGLGEEQLRINLKDLQRLFLVPKPQLIQGEQRFDVNVNTKILVRQLLGSSDRYKKVEAAYKAVTKQLPVRIGRGEVGAIIRQATFLVRNHEQAKAEKLLQQGLEKYLNDPDLLGFLGFVYKAWEPPRPTDARLAFKRASQLKCDKAEMYKHWVRMEMEEHEWTKAAEASEAGLKHARDSRQLLFQAGYARSRLARELWARLVRDKAEAEARKSQELLLRALKSPEDLETHERRMNADIYRALVLNCEILRDGDGLSEYFCRWVGEHPDDRYTEFEWQRLSTRFQLPRPEAWG
jgi:tetratricopeptide (TPR) repeat protein